MGDRPAHVHLHFALGEPLVLDAPLPPEPGGGGRPGGRPWIARAAAATAAPAGAGTLRRLIEDARRAGGVARRGERAGVGAGAIPAVPPAGGAPPAAPPP